MSPTRTIHDGSGLVWHRLLVTLEPLGSSAETGAWALRFQEYLLCHLDKCPSQEPFQRLKARWYSEK